MIAKDDQNKSGIVVVFGTLLIINPAILFMIGVELYLSIALGLMAVIVAVWALAKARKLLPLLFSFYSVFGLLIYGEAVFS